MRSPSRLPLLLLLLRTVSSLLQSLLVVFFSKTLRHVLVFRTVARGDPFGGLRIVGTVPSHFSLSTIPFLNSRQETQELSVSTC